MITEISSKSELTALGRKLSVTTTEILEGITGVEAAISSAPDYDGINISTAANILNGNYDKILEELVITSKNIVSYSEKINELDINDMNFTENTTSSNSESNSGYGQTGSSNNSNSKYSQYTNTGASTITTASTIIGAQTATSNATSTSATINTNEYANTTIKPSGKTSSNGRTQRSAKTEIKVTKGDTNIDVSKYKNKSQNGFNVTTGNLAYKLCDDDKALLYAIVSAESDKSYDDALAVASTILNRCETSNWVATYGKDPIAQATAPNQFVVYQHGYYEKFMNSNAPSTVVQAVNDALAGVRNHKYCSFRSNGSTSYSNNMITSSGNRYK